MKQGLFLVVILGCLALGGIVAVMRPFGSPGDSNGATASNSDHVASSNERKNGKPVKDSDSNSPDGNGGGDGQANDPEPKIPDGSANQPPEVEPTLTEQLDHFLKVDPKERDPKAFVKFARQISKDPHYGQAAVILFVSHEPETVLARGKLASFVYSAKVLPSTIKWLFDTLLDPDTDNERRKRVAEVLEKVNLPTKELTEAYLNGVLRVAQSSEHWGAYQCMNRLSYRTPFQPDYAGTLELADEVFQSIRDIADQQYSEFATRLTRVRTRSDGDSTRKSYRQRQQYTVGLACAVYARNKSYDSLRAARIADILDTYLQAPLLLEPGFLPKETANQLPRGFHLESRNLQGASEGTKRAILAVSTTYTSKPLIAYLESQVVAESMRGRKFMGLSETEAREQALWKWPRVFVSMSWGRHGKLMKQLAARLDLFSEEGQLRLLEKYSTAWKERRIQRNAKQKDALREDILAFDAAVQSDDAATTALKEALRELVQTVK